MRTPGRRTFTLLIALLFAAVTAYGATAADFYLNLMRRGVSDFNAGRFAPAVNQLQIAAFGLLDAVEQFQTAQVYIAVASDRLGREADARRAAQRVLAAERVQRRFGSLALPNDVRTAFTGVVRRLLTSEEASVLNAPATTTTPTRAATTPPQQTTTPPRTQPAPQQTQPAPQQTTTATPPPRVTEERVVTFDPPVQTQRPTQTQTQTPAQTQTQPPAQTQVQRPAPTTPAPTPTPAPRAVDSGARLVEAERLLDLNRLNDARAILRELLNVTLDRNALLRIAEGAYRARDFASVVRAIDRAGALRGGEEPYRYYLAVALYETGAYARAKRELAAALPHIEITPSVARYRAKIEAAVE